MTSLPMPADLLFAPGARATEDALCERLGELLAAARKDPALLVAPVRVVVPSRSLRLHVGAAVAERLGATAGVVVSTLHALALEILARAGETPLGGERLVELLVRREARAERALRAELEHLRDGYGAAVASVRDLLDAGLEPEHEEAARDSLRAGALGDAAARRALALVRVACLVQRGLVARRRGGTGELLRRARTALREHGPALLPTRALLVHGFADATGRATDLLLVLARAFPGCVLLDRPADPSAPEREDPGARFGDRLRERFESELGRARAVDARGARAQLELFQAPGGEAEVREVALRAAAAIERGVRPERIAIVARDLPARAPALRRHLSRLGVPFSALGAHGSVDGPARRLFALLELLERRGASRVDRWLDALERFTVREDDGGARARRPRFDLRLGLRALGAGYLGEAAELVPDACLDEYGSFPLPARRGIFTPDSDDVDEGAVDGEPRRTQVRRMRLGGNVLRGAVAAARSARDAFEAWPRAAAWQEHGARVLSLCDGVLGWSADGEARRRLVRALDLVGGDLPPEETVTPDEAGVVLEAAVSKVAFPEWPGRGGGVQLLDAMQARGRTFERLFVIGLNRDAFPRVLREDPLLPDAARAALAAVLPDVPIKARGHAEERWLFAELLSSAPAVTLSWQFSDENGRERVASPLVERLAPGNAAARAAKAAPLWPLAPAALEGAGVARRPLEELAVLAGLFGGLDDLERALVPALEETGCAHPREAARARAAVLAAHDARAPLDQAPYLGFLGTAEESVGRRDLASELEYVTTLEGLARCPWQAFLRKVLRLEAPPDPLQALPGLDPLVVGRAVHTVLERIVERALGGGPRTLAEALSSPGRELEWPAPEVLDALVLDTARDVLAADHRAFPGLVRALAEHARPFVESAGQRLDGVTVLGAEVAGSAAVVVDGRTHTLGFRADLAARQGGRALLVDFKTGKPFSDSQRKIDAHFLRKVREGRALQAPAYVIGARPESAQGFYWFLKPGTPEHARAFPDRIAPEVLAQAFDDTVAVLFEAWREGLFFPRLEEPHKDSEPTSCRWCEVREACARGDSGAKRRLGRLGRGLTDVAPEDAATAAAVRRLWSLGGEPDAAGEEEEA